MKSIKPRGSRRSVEEPTIPSPSLFASRCVDSRCLHCPNLDEQAENDISSVGAYIDYAKLGDKTLPSQHVVSVIGHDVVHHVYTLAFLLVEFKYGKVEVSSLTR
jgi:hypothetical protein